MVKTATEIFNDKVSLIFEYDKESPLFVRQANTEIDSNNIDRAIEILILGLKLYPEYPTAYMLLGKAYTLIGEYSKALQQIKTGSELLHSKQTYEHYLREIENIKKQRSLFSGSRGSAFLPDREIFDEEQQPDLFSAGKTELPDVAFDTGDEPGNIDDRLEELAREISSARIKDSGSATILPENPVEEMGSSNTIISETLAKIYSAQGEYREAINVYEKLILKTPSKKEEYLEIIAGLESKLNS